MYKIYKGKITFGGNIKNMDIEIGKNYYYVGVGRNHLINKIVKVIDKEDELFNKHNVFIVEDEELNTYRVPEFNLSKQQLTGVVKNSLDKQLLADTIQTFCSFKNGKYVGDYQ